MQPFAKYWCICLFCIIFSSNILAQGTLQGIVTDAIDDEPLIGVNVLIVGTSLGASTNAEGEFIKRQIPAGPIQIRFSYIGYESVFVDTVINSGETLEINIQLTPASIEGEEVRISAQALGQVAAINQQRASNAVVNVVSEEKIQELPDANAAESIGRLSGVSLIRSGGEANKVVLRGLSDKYLNVTVDGVRIPATDAVGRGLDLSSVSQNSLSGIELYKTLTPDKDADAIAGTINLVTRKAPKEQEFRVVAKGGYNDIRSSVSQYDLSFKYGERFLDNVLGVQVNGNIENKIRDNEQISIGYNTEVNNSTDYEINNLDLEYIDENRDRSGIGLILDFNTPDDGNIKLSSSYSSTTRNYLTHSRNYPKDEASVTYSFRDREQEVNLLSTALTGDNRLFGLDTDWSVSLSRSEAHFPYDYEATFLEPSAENSGMRSGIPEIKEDPQIFTQYAYNNFRAATLQEAFYRTQENSDTEFTSYLNLEKEYALSTSVSGSIKAGGKYRSKNRTNEQSRDYAPYYLGYWRAYELLDDGSVTNKDFSGSYFEDFYQAYLENPANSLPSFQSFLESNPDSKFILDDFNMNPLIIQDRLREWYRINKRGINQAGTNPEYHEDVTAEATQYDITETVTAAYVMNTLNVGQFLTAIIGARVEQENHDYENRYSPRQIGGFPVPVGVTRDTSSTYSETVVLPHAHLNFMPTDFLNIRLAAYKALARPDFNQRLTSYFPWRESETGGDRILLVGNPKLETAKAWNYEINTSVFGNRIGLISVSAFYKEIEDMYHNLNGISTSGDTLLTYFNLDWSTPYRGNYNLTVPYNSPETSQVWGLEIDHQINFYWLPGLFKNIVLSYNATWVNSETTLIGSGIDTTYVEDPILGERPVYNVKVVNTKQKLPDQPDFFGNIALGYDIGGFSGRVSVFHQSDYYRSFNPSGRANRIVGEFTRMDFAFTYKVTDYLTLTGNVNNITNVNEKDIQENLVEGYQIPRSMERYGLTFDVGVRLDL